MHNINSISVSKHLLDIKFKSFANQRRNKSKILFNSLIAAPSIAY